MRVRCQRSCATTKALFSHEDSKVSTDKQLLYSVAQADNICCTVVAAPAYVRVATKGIPGVPVRLEKAALTQYHITAAGRENVAEDAAEERTESTTSS